MIVNDENKMIFMTEAEFIAALKEHGLFQTWPGYELVVELAERPSDPFTAVFTDT